jgi:hypothetical protein
MAGLGMTIFAWRLVNLRTRDAVAANASAVSAHSDPLTKRPAGAS